MEVTRNTSGMSAHASCYQGHRSRDLWCSQWMIRAVINNLSPIVITLMSSCTNTFCYNTAGRAFVNGPEMGHQ